VAKQAIVTLVDDIDGGPADETVRFGIGSQQYEIDLNSKNAARLRKQLAPFIARGRPAGRTQRGPRRTAASRQRSRDIRAWALDQGFELSERGRIPASVVDRYEAAVRGASRTLPASLRDRGPVRANPAQARRSSPVTSGAAGRPVAVSVARAA
jgi:Lsr2